MRFSQLSRLQLAAFCLFPAAILILAFTIILSSKKTIAPVSIYDAAPGIYQAGDFHKLSNYYISDITNQFMPWKYYITQFHPDSCTPIVECCGGFQQKTWGIKLPQGFCYPLGGVRPYLAQDNVLFFGKFFSFFTAYDLSYLFLLVSIYFSAFYLFYEMLLIREIADGKNLMGLAALGAALFTTSFPIARDIQYDSLSQSFPCFAIFLGLFLRACFQKRGTLLLASAVFLSLCIFRSTLQDVLLNAMLAGFIIALFFFKELFAALRVRVFLYFFLASIALVACATLIYHLPGITIFLIQPARFVVIRPLSISQILFRRSAGFILSAIQFLFGEIFSSFDTLDFSKATGTMGGQEYFSYDWNSFFVNPIVSAMFVVLVTGFFVRTKVERLSDKQKTILKMATIGILLDYLIILTPLYRYTYFRFHAFYLALTTVFLFLVLLADLRFPFFRKKQIWGTLFACLSMVLCGIWLTGHEDFILHKIQGAALIGQAPGAYKGTLGFDPDFWPEHVHAFVRRLCFTDFYSLAFLGTTVAGAILIRAKKLHWLIVLASLSGLALNTFHYNHPQATTIFEDFATKVRLDRTLLDSASSRGFPLRENVKLMFNLPATSIHESLEYALPEK